MEVMQIFKLLEFDVSRITDIESCML